MVPLASCTDMATPITTAEFLGLSTQPGDTQTLTMTDQLLGGGSGSLFGGVGLAAGLIALEAAAGQPPVYMTCQFASTIQPPDELVVTTEILTKGRTVCQARLTGTSADRTVLALLGATGNRSEDHRRIWRQMPEVEPPEACEPLRRLQDTESLHNHVDVRMARGMFGFAPEDAAGRGAASGDASTLFWTRMPNVVHDAAALALMADYLPSAVGNSLDQRIFCSSLDNTIRFVSPLEVDESSEWVLCESHVEFVAAGFATSRGFLWSRNGTLLASANQSMTAANPRD
ncbi:MAG: thioesterase family protein [Acidimicrobiales bacterium]|jgi:acyl-CoA thioesterase-2